MTREARTTAATVLLVAGIVLIAVSLRPGITVVGPLVGEIRTGLGVSSAGVGLLTTLPLLAFGAVSPLASPVARRIGMERTLGAALVLMAGGTLLRSQGSPAAAFAGTTVMGAGIAAGNVLLPGLVKRDFPRRSGAMSSLYITAMVGMAGIAPVVAVPLADGAGLGWEGALAVWAVPAALALLVWVPRLRERHTPPESERTRMPLRSPLAWQITVFMGLQSLLVFATIAWLPELLADDGLSPPVAGSMVGLMQFVSLASTIGVPVLAARRPSQRGLVAASIVLSLIGFGGLLAAGATLAPLWASLLGLGSGAQLSLALTFLVVRAGDVESTDALSGMVQSGGYFLAAAGPTAMGALYDASGGWTVPLAGLLVVTLATLAAGLAAARDRVLPAARPPGGHGGRRSADRRGLDDR